jgi:hypothetical protein
MTDISMLRLVPQLPNFVKALKVLTKQKTVKDEKSHSVVRNNDLKSIPPSRRVGSAAASCMNGGSNYIVLVARGEEQRYRHYTTEGANYMYIIFSLFKME